MFVYNLRSIKKVKMSDKNMKNSDEILQKSKAATAKLIPLKSEERYKKEYKMFNEWRRQHEVKLIDEEAMLAYLYDLSTKYCGPSLWSKYSMVKSMLLVFENIDISTFARLKPFLKRHSVGHQAKQAQTLTREEVYKFIKNAPDKEYLLTKVVSMIGVAGGCRREELYEMSIRDIEITESQVVITIPKTKTNQARVFTIIKDTEGINFLALYEKYINLRPKNVEHDKLFVGYRHGQCINQRVGIHTIGGVARKIAEFLGLKNPESYTGHSLRRTGSTLLADSGADILVLKRFGGWKSNTVAERYVQDSLAAKNKIARMIQGGESFVQVVTKRQEKESSSKTVQSGSNVCNTNSKVNTNSLASTIRHEEICPLQVNGNENCTIHITFGIPK